MQKSNKKEFILKANIIHLDKYSYDKFEYIKSNIKSVITCPTHSNFEQSPAFHLKGQGCPKCGLISRSNKKRMTIKEFIKKANKVHNSFYSYENSIYINAKSNINIICPLHDGFFQVSDNHLSGKGCPKCADITTGNKGRRTIDTFLKEVKEIHGDKYSYFDLNYKSSKDKIIIFCNTCQSTFTQTIICHIYKKRGCPICSKLKKQETFKNTYRERENQFIYSIWEKQGLKSEKFSGFKVYVLKCWNNQEKFYKIGKTFSNIKKRFAGNQMPYQYEILKVYKGKARKMCELEHFLQRENKEHKYVPNINFGGMYECFSELKEHHITNLEL